MDRREKQAYMKAYSIEYRRANRAKLLLEKRQWYLDNKERLSVRAAARLPERLAIRQAFNRTVPLWAVARNLATNLRQRAKVNGLSYDVEMATTEYIHDWLVRQPDCECCGLPFSVVVGENTVRHRAPSLDRFDLRFGYSRKNTKLICWRCNAVKKDHTAPYLRWLIKFKPTTKLTEERITVLK